jgi:5-methylcytosine-specific restriction endonuclease McrA
MAVNQFGEKKTNTEIFVDESTYPRHRLKERILKEQIIKYECSSCKNVGVWNGELIVLQLEHINGKNNDNRIENLCFLCPNCHSQTKTYAARNRKNPLRQPKRY